MQTQRGDKRLRNGKAIFRAVSKLIDMAVEAGKEADNAREVTGSPVQASVPQEKAMEAVSVHPQTAAQPQAEVQEQAVYTEGEYTGIVFKGGITIQDYMGNAENIRIPDTINGIPVTRIGVKAFQGRENLQTVILPESVLVVEPNAFCNCVKLQKVTLGSKVQEIQGSAFSGSSLKEINLPDTLEKIGAGAFQETKLEKITFPPAIKTLSSGIYSGISTLVSVTIPGGIEKIFDDAFYGCENLKTVYIEEGVKMIDRRAFAECPLLESVTIPSTAMMLYPAIFQNSGTMTGKIKIFINSERTASIIEKVWGDLEGLEILMQ